MPWYSLGFLNRWKDNRTHASSSLARGANLINRSMRLSEILKEESEIRKNLRKEHNITKFMAGSIGLDEDKGIWYGWSHRAVFGFKIGDKIFEEDFGDDDTSFAKHGSKTIKTLDDAKLSAERFSDYVS